MKDNIIYGSIGTALSIIGTSLQTNEVLETISLIITIIGGIITFIITPLISIIKVKPITKLMLMKYKKQLKLLLAEAKK